MKNTNNYTQKNIDKSKVMKNGIVIGYAQLINLGAHALRVMATDELIMILTGIAAGGFLTVHAVNVDSSQYQFFHDKQC